MKIARTRHQRGGRTVITIQIQQLDADGNMFREFRYYSMSRDLGDYIDRITSAYNMAHTRVLVDGVVQP